MVAAMFVSSLIALLAISTHAAPLCPVWIGCGFLGPLRPSGHLAGYVGGGVGYGALKAGVNNQQQQQQQQYGGGGGGGSGEQQQQQQVKYFLIVGTNEK